MSEANLHQRHASQRLTLEHFRYTDDLKSTVEMLNASTGFKPYKIPRSLRQAGTIDDCSDVEEHKIQMGIPPLRISGLERSVGTMAAIGMTVNESAEALNLSASAVKSHRNGLITKCWAPNLLTAMSKLYVHDVISLSDLTVD
jgi:DNA-binding NarL/FixJ family response regulator